MTPRVVPERVVPERVVPEPAGPDDGAREPLATPRLRQRAEHGPARAQIEALARQVDRHPLTVQLLLARGIEPGPAMAKALHSGLRQLRPPTEMAGFPEALALLVQARADGLRVGVFGDYDVDGVTTTAILIHYLEALGVEVIAKVAHRDRGYGLGVEDAEALVQAGAQLVVTGDLGTSDVDALQWLRDRGIKTVVIDHHQVPKSPPPADAFINPHQAACGFPFKGLCSAGVAFYLCAGLRTRLAADGVQNLPDPRALLDLVSLATVCDMMPLRDENRVLVTAGLRHMAQRGRPGLRALLDRAGVDVQEVVDEGHLGFKLGPRINAPGRLGPAEPALALLRSRNDAEAEPLAAHVEMLNAQRRRETEKTVLEALAALESDPKLAARAGLVVAHEGWLPGVAGIAANGIVERYGKPAAVLAIDAANQVARGSVRTAAGIDVRAALARCGDLLTRFGGHKEAAGLALPAQKVAAFVEAFDAAVAEQGGSATSLDDEELIDSELRLDAIDTSLCEAIRAAGPFGMGFDSPRFVARECAVVRTKVLKERHLALTLAQGDVRRDAIAFGWGPHEPPRGVQIDCIFVPQLDVFRGETRVKLHIQRFWRH